MSQAITALFLAEDDASLAFDKRIFRGFGVVQTKFFTTGRAALDHLKKNYRTP